MLNRTGTRNLTNPIQRRPRRPLVLVEALSRQGCQFVADGASRPASRIFAKSSSLMERAAHDAFAKQALPAELTQLGHCGRGEASGRWSRGTRSRQATLTLAPEAAPEPGESVAASPPVCDLRFVSRLAGCACGRVSVWRVGFTMRTPPPVRVMEEGTAPGRLVGLGAGSPV